MGGAGIADFSLNFIGNPAFSHVQALFSRKDKVALY